MQNVDYLKIVHLQVLGDSIYIKLHTHIDT